MGVVYTYLVPTSFTSIESLLLNHCHKNGTLYLAMKMHTPLPDMEMPEEVLELHGSWDGAMI